MSTHKHFDKICCVVIVLTLILTVLFINAEAFGIHKEAHVTEYENKLFDTSKVHTINIIMEDWDEFKENCQSEEYYDCTVVIDDETYKNVAIRGKGNTSLSQVSSYGNDRYSFKIEFDHYDNSGTYYGLDKLCLNNIIQDNTYMKDYLTYQMMAEMGVASPLCSYVYITVNGEDWGLYLAVEAIEDSFLKRNFGSDYGELYKPDSMKMGGGRGNGKQFNMGEFVKDSESMETTELDKQIQNQDENMQNQDSRRPDMSTPEGVEGQIPEGFEGQMPEGFEGQMPEGFEGQMPGGQTPEGFEGQMPGGFEGQMPGGFEGQMPGGFEGQMPGGFEGQMPEGFEGQIPGGQMPEEFNGAMPGNRQNGNSSDFNMPEGKRPFDRMNNGSDDVLLKYIDDEIESYANIFDNAKTDITKSDKTRLIKALKKLSQGENISDTVEIEAVIRYFVVHNFVLNFDSYTGSMIHNYYLYEKDGKLQMLPWDYNLAFGGFKTRGDTTSLVNYPIDNPVSEGNMEERPMVAWIFNNEEYTKLYHTIFEEFIVEYFDSGYFENMFDSVTEMIAPYVEKDPTKFCTYEEFRKGNSTLKEFCKLRAESIRGQLDGSIGSTTETQDSSTFVNAEDLQINDMGSMDNAMGGNRVPGNLEENNPELKDKQEKLELNREKGSIEWSLLVVCAGVLVVGVISVTLFSPRKRK